jgi:hypothetical protein
MDWQEILALTIVAGVGAFWTASLRRGRAGGRRAAGGCHGCCGHAASSPQPALLLQARKGEPAVIRIRWK